MNASTGFLSMAMSILVSQVIGCASIFKPGPDKMNFTSDPPGAVVEVEGVRIGKTPVTGDVSRSAKTACFYLSGYARKELPITRSLNEWVFGNMIFGGIVGVIVDMSSGNHMKADGTLHAELRKARPRVEPDTLLRQDDKDSDRGAVASGTARWPEESVPLPDRQP